MNPLQRTLGKFLLGKKTMQSLALKSFDLGEGVGDGMGSSFHALSLFNGNIPDLTMLWGDYVDTNLTTLYHQIAEISAPIDIIATAVSDGLPVLRKYSDDSAVYDNKYVNKLLATPNLLQNWQELVFQAIAYELVTGKNYLYANSPDLLSFNYKNIISLINLAADVVVIQRASSIKLLTATAITDLIKTFNVPNGNGAAVEVLPEKVMYTKACSLKEIDMNILGKSPMLSAQKAVKVLAAIYEAIGAIYTKGGPRGALVSGLKDAGGGVQLTPTEKENIIKDLLRKYGFGGKKAPFTITDMPLEWVKMGADIKDLEPFSTYQLACAAIYAKYKVPEDLMPGAKSATYENINQAQKRVYETIAIPRAKSFYASLTSFLKLDEAGYYLDVDFSHIKVLQENQKEKASVDWLNNRSAKEQFANGIITLNGWRAMFKMDAVKNALYDKLVYDMTPDELDKVERMLKLTQGNSNGNGAVTGGDALPAGTGN